MSSNTSTTSVEYKVVVLGAGGVGKSALTVQFVRGQFVSTYDPTIEDSFTKMCFIDNESCMVEVMDTAGQEEYHYLRENYIHDGECFLIIYSVCSRDSFTQAKEIYDQIVRIKQIHPNHKLEARVPIILVANKCDMKQDIKVSGGEGRELARTMRVSFVETSAKMNVNVYETFLTAVKEIRRHRQFVESKNSRILEHQSKRAAQTQQKPCVIL